MKSTVLTVLLLGTATTSVAAPQPLTAASPRADILRAYAYSVCVVAAYPETETGADAQRIAESLREALPSAKPETFAAIRNHVAMKNPAILTIKDGRNFGLLHCLEMYESQPLRALVRKLR